jgi:predicted  nucleic acid-binding Zn-ribbon protein
MTAVVLAIGGEHPWQLAVVDSFREAFKTAEAKLQQMLSNFETEVSLLTSQFPATETKRNTTSVVLQNIDEACKTAEHNLLAAENARRAKVQEAEGMSKTRSDLGDILSGCFLRMRSGPPQPAEDVARVLKVARCAGADGTAIRNAARAGVLSSASATRSHEQQQAVFRLGEELSHCLSLLDLAVMQGREEGSAKVVELAQLRQDFDAMSKRQSEAQDELAAAEAEVTAVQSRLAAARRVAATALPEQRLQTFLSDTGPSAVLQVLEREAAQAVAASTSSVGTLPENKASLSSTCLEPSTTNSFKFGSPLHTPSTQADESSVEGKRRLPLQTPSTQIDESSVEGKRRFIIDDESLGDLAEPLACKVHNV